MVAGAGIFRISQAFVAGILLGFACTVQAQDVKSLLPACSNQTTNAIPQCAEGQGTIRSELSIQAVSDLQQKLDIKIFLDNLQLRVKTTARMLNTENQHLSDCAANRTSAADCPALLDSVKVKIRAGFPQMRQHMLMTNMAEGQADIATRNFYQGGILQAYTPKHIFASPAQLSPSTKAESTGVINAFVARMAKNTGGTPLQVQNDFKNWDFGTSSYPPNYSQYLDTVIQLQEENRALYNEDIKKLPVMAFVNGPNPSDKELVEALKEFTANSGVLAAKNNFSADELAGYLPIIQQLLMEDPTKCTAVEGWLTEKYGRDNAYNLMKAIAAGGLLVGCTVGAVVAGSATLGAGAAGVAAVCMAGGVGLTGLTLADAISSAHQERLKAISGAMSAEFVEDFNKLSEAEQAQAMELIMAPTAFIGSVAAVRGAAALLSRFRPVVAAKIMSLWPAKVRTAIAAEQDAAKGIVAAVQTTAPANTAAKKLADLEHQAMMSPGTAATPEFQARKLQLQRQAFVENAGPAFGAKVQQLGGTAGVHVDATLDSVRAARPDLQKKFIERVGKNNEQENARLFEQLEQSGVQCRK